LIASRDVRLGVVATIETEANSEPALPNTRKDGPNRYPL